MAMVSDLTILEAINWPAATSTSFADSVSVVAADAFDAASRNYHRTINYLEGLNPPQLLKLFGALGALSGLLPQVRAFVAVRSLMVNCTVPMNLTGKRLKTKKPYEGPIRAVMFVFSLFVFYQVFSQASSLLVSASLETVMLDIAFQALLFIWLLLQFRFLEHIARAEFAGDHHKTTRILREIDEALAGTGIRLNAIFWTAVIMPPLSLLPRAFEASGEDTLTGAIHALTGTLLSAFVGI
jgi:hypothetical protein